MVQATDNAGNLLFESDGVTPIEIPPFNVHPGPAGGIFTVMGVGGSPFRPPFGLFAGRSPLGFGPRRPLFLHAAGGIPASYWPDGG